MYRLLVAVFSLLSIASVAHGQWTIVASKILGTVAPVGYAGGVITYQGGRVWAGDLLLWYSNDQGLTWQQSSLLIDSATQRITDVAFFDANNGLACTYGRTGGRLYQTSNGGTSWLAIDSSNAGYVQLAYGQSVNVFTVTGSRTYVTRDGGKTWLYGGFASMFLARELAWLYSMEEIPPYSGLYQVVRSTDDGQTWTGTGATVPTDSYSLAIDSCESGPLVLINENEFAPEAHIGHVLISTNAGRAWRTSLTGTLTTHRLTAGVARGRRAIYVGTMWDGVLQSLDYGYTWNSVGGPSCTPDSRSLCCISDNIVLGMHVDGSIWRTTNGGGNPVHVPPLGTFTLSPSSLFVTDSLSRCDSAIFHLAYLLTGPCHWWDTLSDAIVGADSSYFTISRHIPANSSGYDSVVLGFHPDAARDYHAFYVVRRGLEIDSILLIAHGTSDKRSIAAVSNHFNFDTLHSCVGMEKLLWLRSSSCVRWNVRSMTIQGTDSSYFTLKRPVPFDLTGFDSVAVGFNPDSTRSYEAVVHIVLDDGTTLDIPMTAQAQIAAAIVASRTSLFDTIRRSFCDGAIETVLLDDTACSRHSILGYRILGADSEYYSIVGPTATALPDSLSVLFTPDSARAYSASIEILFSDSSRLSIPLHGIGIKATHAFRMPDASAFRDSASSCDPPSEAWLILRDTACQWRSAAKVWLSDSSHFSVIEHRSFGNTLDSILVSCRGDSAGTYAATLNVQYDDTTITIPLTAYGKNTQRSLSASAAALFVGDTVSSCGQPLVRRLVLTDSSCLRWYVTGYRWSGDDSVYYSITTALPSPLTGSDTLAVLFSPDAPRHYNSKLTVLLSDGREVPIELEGDGAPYTQLALSTTELSTEIVGDIVHVPIYLTHNGAIPSINFAVHYDTALLRFVEARSGSGASIAIGSTASGNFHVRIDSADSHTSGLVGSIDFQVFPTTDSCGYVVLDSLAFETVAAKVCAVVTLDSAVARICGPFDCTTPIFSNFLRYTKLPTVSVAPNPTTSKLRVTVAADLGPASIRLYNTIGAIVLSTVSTLMAAAPQELSLAHLPRGTYYVCIQAGPQYKRSVTVVKE